MRAGDTVKHRPTGETWSVACVDGQDLFWCGWPEGWARVADCDLVEACSDAEHRAMLEQWAALDSRREATGRLDERIVVCRRQIEDLNRAYVGMHI